MFRTTRQDEVNRGSENSPIRGVYDEEQARVSTGCRQSPMEEDMLKKSVILLGALLLATAANAQSNTMKNAPGQREAVTPLPAPGASGYAPGQQTKTGTSGPGASSFAPPNQPTKAPAPTKTK